jgi:hypothetical protein
MTDRKEYIRQYQQTEEYKIKNREKSSRVNKEKTRKSTKLRLQKHSIDELMEIVKEICQEKNIDYEIVKEQYEGFMQFLHDPVVI